MQYKSMGRTAAALAVGLSVLLTGCSAQAVPEEAAEAVSASSEPSPSETGPAGPSLPGGDIIQATRGEYLQSTIAPDDPILKYDPSKNLGNPEETFTVEQLQKAQEFALRFITEELIDSPLNDNPDGDVDAWWGEHQNLFEPAWHEDFYNKIMTESGPLMRNPWHEEVESFKYEYVYSPTETRFSDRNLNVKEIYYSDTSQLVIKTDFDVTAKVRLPDGIGAEKLFVDTILGLVPTDQNDSGWMIRYYKWTVTDAELPPGVADELNEKEKAAEEPGADD